MQKCGHVIWTVDVTSINQNHWKFFVHEKNYSPDCTAGEDEGKSGYFQWAVHLPADK